MIRDLFATTAMKVAGVLVLILAIAFAWQTIAIEAKPLRLPFGMQIGFEGWRAKNKRLGSEVAAMRKASDLSRLKQELQKARYERAYRKLAKENDNALEQARIAERDGVERFIAAGGVPDPAGADRCGSPATAADYGPVLRPALREATELDEPVDLQEAGRSETDSSAADLSIVRVPADDVRICTDNTLLAEQLRALVLELEQKSAN